MVPLLSRKLFLQKNLLQIGVRSNNLTVLIKEKGGEKRGEKKKKDTELELISYRLRRHFFEINGN